MEKSGINLEQEKSKNNQTILSRLLSSNANKCFLLLTLAGAGTHFAGEKLGIGYIGAGALKEVVETRNSRLNHTFSLNEISREALAQELIMTTMYAYSESFDIIPKTKGRLSKIADIFPIVRDSLRKVPQSGGVFLRSPDIKTFNDISNSVSAIRSENPSAIIAMDFEGGYVQSPQVSEGDLKKYQFPKKILDLTIEEKKGTKSKLLGQFPSAEYIGKKYQSIKDTKNKKDFLIIMEQYGSSIGRLFSAYGINMIFGPSLDITDSTIGTKNETSPFAKNDRAFSDNSKIVSDLGNAFIRGTLNVPGFIATPKHFVGTGLTTANTDVSRSIDTNLRIGAIVPFRDYVNLHEVLGKTPEEAFVNIQKWQPGGSKYEDRIKGLSDEIKRLQIELTKLELEEKRLEGEKGKFTTTKKSKKENVVKIQTVTKQLHGVRLSINNTRILLNDSSTKKSSEIGMMQNLVQKISKKLLNTPTKPPVIMVGNNDNNFYDSNIPGSLSARTISAIAKELSHTNSSKNGGIGSKGVLITGK